MIPASLLNTINKKHVEKGIFSAGAANDVQWRILRKAQSMEEKSLLSSTTAIFRVSFFGTSLDLLILFFLTSLFLLRKHNILLLSICFSEWFILVAAISDLSLLEICLSFQYVTVNN